MGFKPKKWPGGQKLEFQAHHCVYNQHKPYDQNENRPDLRRNKTRNMREGGDFRTR